MDELTGNSNVARLERKLDGVAAVLATSSRVASGLHPPGQGLLSGSIGLSPLEHVKQILQNDDEALLILNTYRNDKSQYFPFVVLPPDMTLEELKLKPFLFMTIMTIGCRHDLERQSSLARRIREVIAQRVLVKGEQSLDILQGLLVYLAWCALSNLGHLGFISLGRTDLTLQHLSA